MTLRHPSRCPHEHHVPVKVDGEIVARVCEDCHARLHPGWGCPDCDWDAHEVSTQADVRPVCIYHLGQPCLAHREL